MQTTKGPLLGLSTLVAFGASFAMAGAGESWDETEFTAKPDAKWGIVLPDESWQAVDGSIVLDGFEFRLEQTGPMKLMVDTNADGRTDEKVSGLSGHVVLKAKGEDGRRFSYAVRFQNDGKLWKWAAGGAMQGRIEGRLVRLIDQNGNGEFDDFGADAMIVGNGDAASYLSRVVNLGGELYRFDVSPDGAKVSTTPFTGETARLDVASEFEIKGDLVAAVVQAGDVSFNVADAPRGGMILPAGEYRFVRGFATRGSESVQMRGGRMGPIALAAGETQKIEWGGPVVAEFDYRVADEQITVQPNVRFYGSAGEEYHTFQPDAKSPKILIRDRRSGRLVQQGRFGGC